MVETASGSGGAHLFIAGTGRAGTSFLVRYLTDLGLDTTLSRQGDRAFWDDAANAGLEENPAAADWRNLPYVVKTPWLSEFIDAVLTRPEITIDAVIVPMRDLVEVAASRTISELRAMHQAAPWMAELEHSWETWGATAGGIVYSLNPLDQARLLAMGFHRLLERLVQAAIPVILIGFPRLAQDPDYLFEHLRPVLPPGTTADRAGEVHRALRDAAKIRVGDELAGTPPPPRMRAEDRGRADSPVAAFPETERLHRIALGRELGRVRREWATAVAALDAARLRELDALQRAEAAEAALWPARRISVALLRLGRRLRRRASPSSPRGRASPR